MSEAAGGLFAKQAGWCRELGSPFTAELIDAMAQDLAEGGVVADLLRGFESPSLADAIPLRLAAALHAAALSGRDPALTAQYPPANAAPRMAELWPLARAYLQREFAWASAFIQSPPQTNETRRTIALLPGFLACAGLGPLHLLEIGASAGLNQTWDRFRFRTDGWSWGDGPGPVIDTDWRGPAPAGLDAPVVIASRAGCDVAPIDVRDPEQRLRLKSYIWPDQPERLARLDAAIAVADGPAPERADAGAWLAARLAGELPLGVTVIFHSVVWQYLPESTKTRAEAAIAAAAARATADARLAWLRFEPAPIVTREGPKSGFLTDVTLWPGAERRVLNRSDGHARRVEVLA